MANKLAQLTSQVANLEAQNARLVKELEAATETGLKCEAFWIAAEKQIEELEARTPDQELVGILEYYIEAHDDKTHVLPWIHEEAEKLVAKFKENNNG